VLNLGAEVFPIDKSLVAFHRSRVKERSQLMFQKEGTQQRYKQSDNPASLPDHSHAIQDSTNDPTDQIPKELCHRGSFPLTQEFGEISELRNI
jgi:hypothetical protein